MASAANELRDSERALGARLALGYTSAVPATDDEALVREMSRQLRKRIFAIGDDFWIEDADGNRVFKVNGKAFACLTPSSLRTPTGTSCPRSRRRSSASATR